MTVRDYERTAPPTPHRWTREEFYQLAEQGYFQRKRVMLIDGEIIDMSPHGKAHAYVITYLTHWAISAFGKDFLVRPQLSLNATEYSDPEPDIAIVPGPLRRDADHPSTAALIIEVAESCLAIDRKKAKIYAQAGVEDYWIVNTRDSQIEVFRKPLNRERYESNQISKPPQTISPLARPQAILDVADLFR